MRSTPNAGDQPGHPSTMGFNLPEGTSLICLHTYQQKQHDFRWHLSPLPSQHQSFHMASEGKKITGPWAASETYLITSTSFQRAPVVALQVYSNPSKCQTKAPLSSSAPVKQLYYFSELHLLGGSSDYHNTGAGFGLGASPLILQQARALGWLENKMKNKGGKRKSN